MNKRRVIKTSIWIIVIAIVVTGTTIYWQHEKYFPSTDDAYINANVVHVAAQVTGPVDQIYVKNYQEVKKGQLLFTIVPKPFILAVDQAKAALQLKEQQVASETAAIATALANVTEARAKLINTQQHTKRILELLKVNQVSQNAADQAVSELRVDSASLKAAQNKLKQAQAQRGEEGQNNADIAQARASLNQAKLDLQHTKVKASTSGFIVNFNLREGSMIAANNDLFEVVDKTTWWVDANFKETQLDRIKIGQPVSVVIDMYPNQVFHGIVENISRGSGSSFSLLPPENATGNWVKVTQRFPVKIALDTKHNYPLRIGASSIVTVDTTSMEKIS